MEKEKEKDKEKEKHESPSKKETRKSSIEPAEKHEKQEK